MDTETLASERAEDEPAWSRPTSRSRTTIIGSSTVSGPARHADVPGYIRLIAPGDYNAAYMLNRESNVFPGIIGRTCDRPCEPACRRGRLEGQPVAICRLKRVAADLKRDIAALLPKAPRQERQARRLRRRRPGVADGGPRPGPLGYEVVMFD